MALAMFRHLTPVLHEGRKSAAAVLLIGFPWLGLATAKATYIESPKSPNLPRFHVQKIIRGKPSTGW